MCCSHAALFTVKTEGVSFSCGVGIDISSVWLLHGNKLLSSLVSRLFILQWKIGAPRVKKVQHYQQSICFFSLFVFHILWITSTGVQWATFNSELW